MTILDTAAPGTCPCGEIASSPHACEDRPTRRRLRLCECGEFTYSPTCLPCRLPEPPEWPETTITVPVSRCHRCRQPGWNCLCESWVRS